MALKLYLILFRSVWIMLFKFIWSHLTELQKSAKHWVFETTFLNFEWLKVKTFKFLHERIFAQSNRTTPLACIDFTRSYRKTPKKFPKNSPLSFLYFAWLQVTSFFKKIEVSINNRTDHSDSRQYFLRSEWKQVSLIISRE